MGKIMVGGKTYESGSFKIIGNCLRVGSDTFQLCDAVGRVQLKGSNLEVGRLHYPDGNILFEGNVDRVVASKYLLVVGKVLKFFVETRRWFFNDTASTDISDTKKGFRSKVPWESFSRVVVKVEGYFSEITIRDCSDINVEVWLKGKCLYVKGNVVSVVGKVSSASVGEAMYITKK